jgi:hypothetical protein
LKTSDALLIGGDWISEHYFTTEATSQSFHSQVLARRKQWDEDKAHGTIRTRFAAQRSWLLDTLTTLTTLDATTDVTSTDPNAADVTTELYSRLHHILGFDGLGLHTDRTGPIQRISAPGLAAGAPLVLIQARPVATIEALLAKDQPTLLVPWQQDDKTQHRNLARALSAVFVAEDPPQFALVLAGRWLLVAEQARWAEGRYLAVDLQLVCERNDDKRGGEVDRALTCVGGQSLAPDAEGQIWWANTLAASIKHTVGVSQDLREGVRLSIEILANEVVARRARAGLSRLPPAQAQVLATQSLRFCSSPRPRPSWGCCRLAPPSTPPATAWTGCGI